MNSTQSAPENGKVVSIILPAYNEAAALPHVLNNLHKVLDTRAEIIVVDDGSQDATAEVARTQACRLIQHPTNRGKGAAIQTGIAHAQGQYLIIMDADATYPVEAIPRMVALLANHDLVRCKRPANPEHMPLVNKVGNWLFDRLLTVLHGLEGSDHLSGLYGLRREAALRLKLEARGFDIEAEIGIKAQIKGLRVASFPITYQPRLGEKKLNPWRDGLQILGRILTLLVLYNSFQIFVMPGVVLLLFSVLGAIILGRGPVITPYFGLSIHSFIVVTLGGLAAFQLIVFGLVAALYSFEAGSKPRRWLIWLSSRWMRLGGIGLGLGATAIALLDILRATLGWLLSGAGIFVETRALVISATILVGGLQLLSAAMFLSIFSGRLHRADPYAVITPP